VEGWVETRRALNAQRAALAERAVDRYPGAYRIQPTPLLSRPEWVAARPVPLDRIALDWVPAPPAPAMTGAEPSSTGVRGEYPTYSAALASLDPPRLLEDRPCYRLLDLEWTGGSGRMSFGPGRYFQTVDVCEAAAHEFAAGEAELPFRTAVGEPCALDRRAVIPALSVLTIRRAPGGQDRCVLHWRDPAQVAHGGGQYQVMPVGVFQPSADGEWNELNDFDLWRCVVREYAEEYLGGSEDYGSADHPIDYAAWPFAAALDRARTEGRVRVSCLALGVDPLSLAADLLMVAVFDADTFDATFENLVDTNDEGTVHQEPFTAATVEEYVYRKPIQPAGAGLLELAWRNRDALLT
jgi:hypothetical protein